MILCPHCQSQNPDGTVMCNQCLQSLYQDPLQGKQRSASLAAGPVAQRLRWVQIENLQPTGHNLNLPELDFEGEILIGRNDLSHQIVVDLDLSQMGGLEKWVSRQHARLIYDQHKLYLEDWASQFGTWHNKEKLAAGERRELKAGDEIRLANLAFRMEVL